MILHDHTHLMPVDADVCPHCGQRIAPPPAYGTGVSKSRRIGIAISVLLHVLIVAYYLTHDEVVKRAPPPANEVAMLYIPPQTPQAKATPSPKPAPKPKPQPEKTQVAKAAKTKPVPRREVATITPPRQQEVVVPQQVSPLAIPPPQEQDMASMIAAKRAKRAETQAQQSPSDAQPAEESDNDRAMRIARANIAGAQGKNGGADREDSGGVFSIMNKTYHSADVKFRGWNVNFKRTWTQQVTVEQGNEVDLETAIVKRMIELIRKEKPGDFVWESHRLGRNVNLSARPADQAELEAFLLKEFFPNYQPPRR